MTESELEAMAERYKSPYIPYDIRQDTHALIAEVRRLRALLPCPECKCNVAMHALTCSKGGRTGE